MYRGIQKLKDDMPGVFSAQCVIRTDEASDVILSWMILSDVWSLGMQKGI
ncbi:MAG: hypothetical protein P8P83_04375 [Rickettsiaceae bacterium]|nr:hypothetical protein [Rickettsiaceae bacterium]